ncbi:MAG: zf-TFIIB domain-containing protein [Bdellovibrionales bacterium]
MECPACGNQLSKEKVNNIELDVCKSCSGIWFDNFEYEKIESIDWSNHSYIAIAHDSKGGIKPDRVRECPKCDNIKLMRHYFSPDKSIEIDECGACGGIWLDQGEFANSTKIYSSDEERVKAAEKMFQEIAGGEFARIAAQSSEFKAKADKFAYLFRFLLPSYWIPGKQDGGAF